MNLRLTIEAAQRLQDQSYEQGAADERERIAQSFDREAEWREEIEKHAPTLKGGALLFRSWAREIRESGDIPVRENAPQKENSVATKPLKGNTNDS